MGLLRRPPTPRHPHRLSPAPCPCPHRGVAAGPKTRMNVDAVLAPAGDRRGCFEPVDGEVYATSTERAVPARAKARGKAWGEGAGKGAGGRRGGRTRLGRPPPGDRPRRARRSPDGSRCRRGARSRHRRRGTVTERARGRSGSQADPPFPPRGREARLDRGSGEACPPPSPPRATRPDRDPHRDRGPPRSDTAPPELARDRAVRRSPGGRRRSLIPFEADATAARTRIRTPA